MGAGKTRVGLLLARRLDWSFIDTDERVEAASGMPIAEIFALESEAGFRRREREVLQALPERGSVVALGGGAVCSEENRELLREKGALVWLDASAATLAARVGAGDERPLLAGLEGPERAGRLERLRSERVPAYASAALRVETDGHTPEQVRDAVLQGLGWEDAA
jgi:shikimate kinase